MASKKLVTALLIIIVSCMGAQDTLNKNKIPDKRHELGISIIVPVIYAIGAADYNERYSNIAFRYFITKKHAIKPFVGFSPFSAIANDPKAISTTNTSTLYLANNSKTPSNFQLGVGYEFIIGKRKLKQVLGADIYYNNKFLREELYYYRHFDSTDVHGSVTQGTTKLDTGRYVRTTNYDKIGFNLSYGLRYEASKRWVITASTIVTNKLYWSKSPGLPGRSSNFEMNVVGLISDICVFYRF